MSHRMSNIVSWLFLLPSLLAGSPAFADATSFDPTTVTVEAKSSGGVPVGTIIAWPVATNPEDMDNWLECNGQSVDKTAFPELFAVVGSKVPDLRGLFLRGFGGASLGLGIIQSSAVGNHMHEIKFSITNHRPPGGSAGGNRSVNNVGVGTQTAQTSAYDDGEAETRPRNTAVRYLIRSVP